MINFVPDYYFDFKNFCINNDNISICVNEDGEFLACHDDKTIMKCNSRGIHIGDKTFQVFDECIPFLMPMIMKEKVKEIKSVDI